MSYADANQVKLIHAQTVANVANRNAVSAGPDVTRGEHVSEFGARDTERDDEGQVEQQLQWRGHPMALVGITARHPSDVVGAWRGGQR